MNNQRIKSIVIVGGGTAGWMAAALLSKHLPSEKIKITLVESDEIGTIGVGEATIPLLKSYNRFLGIDEATFMKETNATFKLGINFVDWAKLGDTYIHPFASYGNDINGLQFHHYWAKMKSKGEKFSIEDYSISIVAARAGKFMKPLQDNSSLLASVASRIDYAYHIDAGLFSGFLRKYAENQKVQRIEGKVVNVNLKPENGFIDSINLASGKQIQGDMFIDCTGFRGLLIEGALETGYEDWSHLLPMDRAIAVPTKRVGEPIPYTVATARSAGWTWKIPLQNRMGNGHVYCSKYMEPDEATGILLNNITGEMLADPKHIRFTTGRRKQFWNKNCVALGLASGFLEPLESTSIHLIQDGLMRLLALLPDATFNPAILHEYNRALGTTYERIRDFLVLHYVATEREDSQFWKDMQSLKWPDTLLHRVKLLQEAGHFVPYDQDLFGLPSWLAVAIGQRRGPMTYSPIADSIDERKLAQHMKQLRGAISELTRKMPTHQQFIDRYCKSDAPMM